MKIKQAWKLPIVFLVGYLCGWASVLIDRQMLLDEQRQLQNEINGVRIELKLMTMMDEHNEDYKEQIEWNRKALEAPKPEEVGK